MAENMALIQGALSYPKVTCDSATMDIVDVEFAIVDVEGQLRDVASALATKSNIQSFLDLLFQLDLLSSFTPENRLKLQRKHLSRLQAQLAQDSARKESIVGLEIRKGATACSRIRIVPSEARHRSEFAGQQCLCIRCTELAPQRLPCLLYTSPSPRD